MADNEGQYGGGIYMSLGNLVVLDGTVMADNRSGGGGGGIFASSSVVSITNSTITGNQASVGGGGLFLLSSGATIYGTTISYNFSATGAGGLFAHLTPSESAVNLGNSTFFGNLSSASAGGAIGISGAGVVALASVTIAENLDEEGVAVHNQGELSLINTILSGSCEIWPGAIVRSYGSNLVSPGFSCELALEPGWPPDLITAVDPQLSAIADFGGPTRTVLPLAGSPAIDNGSAVGAGLGCPELDQRGFARPAGAGCDCGAVERQPEDLDPLFIDGFESGSTSAWSP